MLTFAYGSNMCLGRLVCRVPSATFMAVGVLHGFVLRFNKRSEDHSGKGNAVPTGQAGDAVWGVVFEFDRRDESRLDHAEGVGNGYTKRHVSVDVNGSLHEPAIYIAEDERYIDNGLAPYDWYLRHVLEGARHHGLPAVYIAMLQGVSAIPDRDLDRRARELSYPCNRRVDGPCPEA